MITINTQDNETGRQLEITYPQADPAPAGDLVGRSVIFYPSRRIGPLMGTITQVTDTAYVVRVTSGGEKAGRREIGKLWRCAKETTAVMLF